MKFVRYMDNGESVWGIVEDQYVRLIDRAPWERGWCYVGTEIKSGKVKPLAPVEPRTIVCVGKNYYDHAVEMKEEIPKTPILFLKPVTALNDPDAPIYYPASSQRVDFEGELAIVIGKTASRVKAANALDYICGYTIMNDVTARDIQKGDGQWTRGKGFDGFAPAGPYLVTELDASDLKVETRLNGQVRQQGRTSQFMFKIPQLIEFITDCMTLHPGDLISTGTPAGIGPMECGDTVEIEIEGIGILKNHVVERKGE